MQCLSYMIGCRLSAEDIEDAIAKKREELLAAYAQEKEQDLADAS